MYRGALQVRLNTRAFYTRQAPFSVRLCLQDKLRRSDDELESTIPQLSRGIPFVLKHCPEIDDPTQSPVELVIGTIITRSHL